MKEACERVFVIGLDGAIGRTVREAETPNIDELLGDGVVNYSARTVLPSASFEAWGAMFHGVGPEKHRLGGSQPCPEDTSWSSFMKVAKQRNPEIRCASFSCWEPINTNIIELSCDCHCVSMPDPQLTEAAAEYIRKSPPDLYFMQLDFIDGAGHSHGYDSQEYLDQINATDALLGEVVDAIRDAGVFDESLIITLSDHGGNGTSHGGDHPDCMNIFWGCRGSGVKSGVELDGEINIMDTAAIVAHALDLPAPAGWDAKIPDGIFE